MSLHLRVFSREVVARARCVEADASTFACLGQQILCNCSAGAASEGQEVCCRGGERGAISSFRVSAVSDEWRKK
jgi:hypothetical protein